MLVTNIGIPTEYKGTTFRSRLEARWARFFDLIGWNWEYEPFDACGYIPDFIIMGKRPLLIEVKPYAYLGDLCAEGERIKPLLQPVWDQQVAVFGISPLMNLGEGLSPGIPVNSTRSELVTEDGQSEDHDSLGREDPTPLQWAKCRGLPYPPHNEKCNRIAVHHLYQSWTAIPCGHYDGDGHLEHINLQEAWSIVRNATKWHA